MIACSVDDFPAPFGPIRPDDLARPDLEREPAHGGDRPVAHLEPLHDECGPAHDGPSWTALSPR